MQVSIAIENILMGSKLADLGGEGRICGPFSTVIFDPTVGFQRERFDNRGHIEEVDSCNGRNASGFPARSRALRGQNGRIVEIREFECDGTLSGRLAVEWSSANTALVFAFGDDGQPIRRFGPLRTISGTAIEIYIERRMSRQASPFAWTRYRVEGGRVVSIERPGRLSVSDADIDRIRIRHIQPNGLPDEILFIHRRDRYQNIVEIRSGITQARLGLENTIVYNPRGRMILLR
jgi:hypothetical protein